MFLKRYPLGPRGNLAAILLGLAILHLLFLGPPIMQVLLHTDPVAVQATLRQQRRTPSGTVLVLFDFMDAQGVLRHGYHVRYTTLLTPSPVATTFLAVPIGSTITTFYWKWCPYVAAIDPTISWLDFIVIIPLCGLDGLFLWAAHSANRKSQRTINN